MSLYLRKVARGGPGVRLPIRDCQPWVRDNNANRHDPVWEAVILSSEGEPLPQETEERLSDFSELVATAISNTANHASSSPHGRASSQPATKREGESSATSTTAHSSG